VTISDFPSVVTLPAAAAPYPSILDFLSRTFPAIPRTTWEQRVRDGKVHDEDGSAIANDTPYVPGKRIFYFREVAREPAIPFEETILFQNDELLAVCKPPFLPVTPGGRFVNECLLNRLRRKTGIADLAPIHRLDRETAGVVLFSVNRATRGRYHDLFMHGEAEKTYLAVARITEPPQTDRWVVENRIVRGEPRFRMTTEPGMPNARSVIHLLESSGTRSLFRLHPKTGKTHQLRVHMAGLGFPIVNDRCYPELLAQQEDDFERPLQLLAKSLRFRHPLTGRDVEFVSGRELRL
jgi:tRNA pseudouridine32 synthase / 23S rRNA pseudouridine746 synthase